MSVRDSSLSFFSPTFPYSLPHTDYNFTVTSEILRDEPSNRPRHNPSMAVVELRIRQSYALFVEPIRGCKVSMDDHCIVSPEVTLQFKIPLFLLNIGPSISPVREAFVSQQLASFPISAGLGEFLKPHIQNYAVSLAQGSAIGKEFKVIFSVMVFKIDLANKQECDRIHSQGCSKLRKGKSKDVQG